jgi:O-antigen/teichoic acid export membrane protein
MNKFSAIVLRNSTFGMVAQFLIKILSFGFSVLVVRRLGATDFGQYSGVIAFVSTFAFLSDLGLGPYSIREIARLRDRPDGHAQAAQLYGNVLRLRLLLSLVTVVLVTAAAWMTGRPLIMVAAIGLNGLGLFLYAVQGGSEAVLSGFERLDISATARVLNQLVFVLLGALVLFLGLGYFGLVVSGLVGTAVLTVICWRGVRSLGVFPAPPRREDWLSLLKMSLPFGIITLALGLSYKFDTVLLTIFRGDAETGYYNAAYNLVFSAVVFSNVINTAMYPSLSRHSVHSPQNLPGIYSRTLRYMMAVSLPIAVGIWALAEHLVPFLYTAKYMPAVQALQIVVWVVPLMFASEFLGYIVVIANQERVVARSVVISTCVNIGANLILVPRFGFVAAAVMTVLTEAVLVGQYVWALREQLARTDLKAAVLLPLLSALLMGVVLVVVRAWMGLLPCILIGGLVYMVLLFFFRVIGLEDIRSFRNKETLAEIAVK